MSTKCEKCGSVGSDRRTLWMSCMYAMNELDVPFTEVSINGSLCEKVGEDTIAHDIKIPKFAEPDPSQARKYGFYTMKVCKRCRAEWMGAIEDWYKTQPEGEDMDSDEPAETQADAVVADRIFVRDKGQTKEISRAEWDRLHPDSLPVVFRG